MYRSLFSYYGGKSKLAHLYPPPRYGRIVEPFAGGASYSLMYCDREVYLYDVDRRVAAIWEFLLSPDASDWVDCIPDSVEVGDDVDEVLLRRCPEPPPGLVYLCRAEANHGTMGKKGNRRAVTWMGKKTWRNLKPKLRYWIPRVRHWKFELKSWEEVPTDTPATWFVDPPYQCCAGAEYLHSRVDYAALRDWCLQLPGQVVVCGSTEDSWLPFVPLAPKRGIVTRFQKFPSTEAVWVRDGPGGLDIPGPLWYK